MVQLLNFIPLPDTLTSMHPLYCHYLFFLKKQPLFHIIVINNVLVSGEQQSESVTHISCFKFFSYLGYSRVLNRVPCILYPC